MTNCPDNSNIFLLVPKEGFEPSQPLRLLDSKSSASSNFTTSALFSLAEGVGFEPTDLLKQVKGFQVPRIRPLCHPSDFHIIRIICNIICWRSGRDLNPRDSFQLSTRLAGGHLWPLGHRSITYYYKC